MLTAKREAYVNNLISGMSQREAYRAAFNTKNASDRTIDNKASKLLKEAEVWARYEQLRGEVAEKAKEAAVASALEVLAEMTDIAFGRKKYPAVDMFGNEYMNPVSMPNRVKALELLAKHHNLLTDNVKVSGSGVVQIVDDLGGGAGGD